MPAREPIRRPLPHFADHVVNADPFAGNVPLGRCAPPARRRACVSRAERRPPRSSPRATAGIISSPQAYTAPSIPAARGYLPLRFRLQTAASHARTLGVVERHVHDGWLAKTVELCAATRIASPGPSANSQPFADVPQVDGALRLAKNHRSRMQQLGQRTRIVAGLGGSLGNLTWPSPSERASVRLVIVYRSIQNPSTVIDSPRFLEI